MILVYIKVDITYPTNIKRRTDHHRTAHQLSLTILNNILKSSKYKTYHS